MEKIQTPLAAGVGGAAVLAAILSLSGGDAKRPAPAQNSAVTTQSATDDSTKGTFPNQEGPWRAVCEEYAPNGVYPADPRTRERGYKIDLLPKDSPEGAVERTIKDPNGLSHRITVHKQLLGNLVACVPPKQLQQLHLIIATVPDPDKTEMRLEFDRYIEALERAAAIRGFHYTGYWFPWTPRQTEPPPHKEDEVEVALLRAEQPGILLFHNNDGERLFLFIVGETPTSGINRTQMTQALSYRQSLIEEYKRSLDPQRCGTKQKIDEATRRRCEQDQNLPPVSGRSTTAANLAGPLMISGPHFSGGLISLGEVLHENGILNADSGSSSKVEILSPDASSKELISNFTKIYCKDAEGCFFRSISDTSEGKDRRALQYLKTLGYEPEEVVELVEDESGFGDNAVVPNPPETTPLPGVAASPPPQSTSSPPAAAKPPVKNTAAPATPAKTLAPNPASPSVPAKDPASSTAATLIAPNLLKLTFPRELSAARTLSDQQSEELAASGSKLLSLSKRSTDVKLAGQEPLERDRPATYATDAEASEITSALEDDMRFITEHGLKAVIVSASNPLDRVFLLAYIHDRLPNVRLVAEDSDELIVSHPHFVDLTGTIVVSSVPTVPEFSSVKNQDPSSISFSSVAAEEQFISTALLLDSTWKPEGTKSGSDWPVSIAGETGFELIPLQKSWNFEGLTKVYGSDTENQDQKRDISDTSLKTKRDDGVAIEIAAPDRTPRAFITLSLSIFLLTALHLVMLLNSISVWFRTKFCKLWGAPLKEERFLPRLAYVKRPNDKARAEGRAFNLLGLNSQIMLMNLLVLVVNPVINPMRDGLPGLRLIAAIAWIMVAAVLSIWVADWLQIGVPRKEVNGALSQGESRTNSLEKRAVRLDARGLRKSRTQMGQRQLKEIYRIRLLEYSFLC